MADYKGHKITKRADGELVVTGRYAPPEGKVVMDRAHAKEFIDAAIKERDRRG